MEMWQEHSGSARFKIAKTASGRRAPNPLLKVISVIVCTFNHEEFIEQCLRSLLNQEGMHSKFEIQIIVVDDLSADNSVEVASDALAQSAEEALIICKKNNCGLKDSIEVGLGFARGDFIQIISGDDYVTDEKFQLQVAFLLSNPTSSAVYGGCWVREVSGKLVLQDYDHFRKLSKCKSPSLHKVICELESPLPMGQSALFRSEQLRRAFQCTRSLLNDDWSLLILLSRSSFIGYIDKPLVVYRIHSSQSHQNRSLMLLNQFEVIQLLIEPEFRRRSLASVLKIHSLTFATHKQLRNAVYFAYLSIATTGVVAPWLNHVRRFVLRHLKGFLPLDK